MLVPTVHQLTKRRVAVLDASLPLIGYMVARGTTLLGSSGSILRVFCLTTTQSLLAQPSIHFHATHPLRPHKLTSHAVYALKILPRHLYLSILLKLLATTERHQTRMPYTFSVANDIVQSQQANTRPAKSSMKDRRGITNIPRRQQEDSAHSLISPHLGECAGLLTTSAPD